MKLNYFPLLIPVFLIFGNVQAQTGNHIIKLSFDIKPYVKSRDIEAKIFINNTYRISLRPDNTSFARISALIPKQPKDSIVEIQIVVNKPSNYIVPLGQKLIRYYEGTITNIRVESTDWLKKNGLKELKSMMTNGISDTSLNYASVMLTENLFNNTSEEIELTQLLSKNYFAKGDYEKSYSLLESLSLNKIKKLDGQSQTVYLNDLFETLKYSIVSDSTKSDSTGYIAETIFKDKDAVEKWKQFTIKILSVPGSEKDDLKSFQIPVVRKQDIEFQLEEVNDLFKQKSNY